MQPHDEEESKNIADNSCSEMQNNVNRDEDSILLLANIIANYLLKNF